MLNVSVMAVNLGISRPLEIYYPDHLLKKRKKRGLLAGSVGEAYDS